MYNDPAVANRGEVDWRKGKGNGKESSGRYFWLCMRSFSDV